MTHNAGKEQIHGFFISLVSLDFKTFPSWLITASVMRMGIPLVYLKTVFSVLVLPSGKHIFFFELSARRLILSMAGLFL